MKIIRKHGDILEANADVIVFPTGLYQMPNNTILKKIKFPMIFFVHFNDNVKKHIIDIGMSYNFKRFDNKNDISLLITCFDVNDEINKNNKRKIDYEMLYSSLIGLRADVMFQRYSKIAFCMNDFISLGCDEEILKTMVKQVFNEFYEPISITFIYGE